MARAVTCVHHPDRPGHALCMACRNAVCAECATDWEGINYCAPCLSQRRSAVSSGGGGPAVVLLAAACALLLLAAARLMVWAGVILASLE